jgi:hypothetical protein
MSLTVDSFLEKFPEFTGRITEEALELLIEQIGIETCNYSGITDAITSEQCLALRIAYEIERAKPLNQFMSGNVKKIESLNDVIEYGVSSISPEDFQSNIYGVRLKRLLTVNYSCGFMV